VETRTLTFQPPWWATLALVAAGSLFVTAGFWQLDRADQKRALFSNYDLADARSTLRRLPTDAEAADLRYQPVELSGRYQAGRQVLLDNMLSEGKPGYQVLTPLFTVFGPVLVNRGWLPASADRSELPNVTVAEGERTVRARLDRLPRPGIRLEPTGTTAESPWPRRLLYPDAEQLRAELQLEDLPGYQLLLQPDEPDGYRRNWRPAVMGPDKHLGYAVQWFSFTAAILVIYFFLNLKRKR
jgi:surfeit locus 1 family protein